MKRDGIASDNLREQTVAQPQDESVAGERQTPEHIQPESLMERVFERSNLKRALKQVRQNKGAPVSSSIASNGGLRAFSFSDRRVHSTHKHQCIANRRVLNASAPSGKHFLLDDRHPLRTFDYYVYPLSASIVKTIRVCGVSRANGVPAKSITKSTDD